MVFETDYTTSRFKRKKTLVISIEDKVVVVCLPLLSRFKIGVEARTSGGGFSFMTVSNFKESERELGSRVSDKATFWNASGTGISVRRNQF